MKITISILFFLFLITLPFCTTSKKTTATKEGAMPKYNYIADISPIMVERCTPCHFPETGKKKLLNTYEAVSTNIDDIISRVQLPHDDPKFMPFKSKKEPLSDSLITVIKVWKETGMKVSK